MPKRTFLCGGREIAAPLEHGSLEDNVKQLMINFPFFRFTQVLDSDAVALPDGSLQYVVHMPPSKTNG